MPLSTKSRYVPPHLRENNKHVVVAKMEEEQQPPPPPQANMMPPASAMRHIDPHHLPPPSSAPPHQVPQANGGPGRNNRSYTNSPAVSAARLHHGLSPRMIDEGIANWRKNGPQEQPDLLLDDEGNPQSSQHPQETPNGVNGHAHVPVHARRFESRRNQSQYPRHAHQQAPHGMPPTAHHAYHGPPPPVDAHVHGYQDEDMDPNELQFAKLAMAEEQQHHHDEHASPPPANGHEHHVPPPPQTFYHGMPATDVRVTQPQPQQHQYDSPFRSDPHVRAMNGAPPPPFASHADPYPDSHAAPPARPPQRPQYRAKYAKKDDQGQHDQNQNQNQNRGQNQPQPPRPQQQRHGNGNDNGNGHERGQQRNRAPQFGARGGGASRYNRAYASPQTGPTVPLSMPDEALLLSELPNDAAAPYEISENFQTVNTEQPSQRSNRRQRRDRQRKNNHGNNDTSEKANTIIDTLNEKSRTKSPQKSSQNSPQQRHGQVAHNHKGKDKKRPEKPPLPMPGGHLNVVSLAATKKTKAAPVNWAAELKTKRNPKNATASTADVSRQQAMRKPPIISKTAAVSQPSRASANKVRSMNGQNGQKPTSARPAHGQTQRQPPVRATATTVSMNVNMNVNVKPTAAHAPFVGFQPHHGKSAAAAPVLPVNEFDSSQPFCSDAEKVKHVLEVLNMSAADWDNVSKLFRHFDIQYNTMLSLSKRWFVVFERPSIAIAALNTVKHPRFKLRRIDTDPSLVQMLKNNVPPPTRPPPPQQRVDTSVAKRMIDHHLAFNQGGSQQMGVDARYHQSAQAQPPKHHAHAQQSYAVQHDNGYGHRDHTM